MKSSHSGIVEDKNAVRARVRERILEINFSTKNSISQQITKRFVESGFSNDIKSLFIYVSLHSEVSTSDLIKIALQSDIKVFVPKMANGYMTAQQLMSVNQLVPGKWGILETNDDEPPACHIDLVITPGLAFTIEGTRLGKGAGYYDKWLSNNSYTTAVALAYDEFILDKIPADIHDIQVDALITEKRTILCRTKRGAKSIR